MQTACDFETPRYRAGLLAPPVACFSRAWRLPDGPYSDVIVRHDLPQVRVAVEAVLNGTSIWQNGAYDLTVIGAEWPDLLPTIFQALHEGRVYDVMLREQLIMLSLQGDLNFLEAEDGTGRLRVDHSLAELEHLYGVNHGVDRKKQKEGADALRVNYHQWIDLPRDQWPQDALDYPEQDALGTLMVYEGQEQRLATNPVASVATQELRLYASFCLRLMTCMGICIDHDKRREIIAQVEAELTPDKVGLLYEAAVVRRAVPPRQRKLKGEMVWTKGEKESVDQAKLRERILQVCAEHELEIKETKTGLVSFSKDVMEVVAPFDAVLAQFQHRQYLQKLVSTELPRLSGPIVYPQYRALVETGRISSHGFGKNVKDPPFPSCNITNVSSVRKVEHLLESGDKDVVEINVRHCYVPRPGWLMVSCDFESIEFVAMAQYCYSRFGHSVMREVINSGHNPHDFLGAQLALHLDAEFGAMAQSAGVADDLFACMEYFKSLKGSETYAKYRTLAKPVGFGFGGGLGAKKFIEFARKDPYRIVVTLEQARRLKVIWLQTYTEAPTYFQHVTNELVDPYNRDEDGRPLFRYTSPLGLVRAGAAYTAACNGAWLQTPAADGALLAVCAVTRACYDSTIASCLLGCHVLAFVHDDIITEIPDDQWLHERAHEQARLQIEAMKVVMPDVEVRCKPAAMSRWDKKAQTVYGSDGRLQVWHA